MSSLQLASDTLTATPSPGNIEYNGQFYGTDTNSARAPIQRMLQGSVVLSTSGPAIDFTNIPSWVKRITIMYSGVSTSSTANWQVQLGTGVTPTYATSGYASTMIVAQVGAATVSNASTGFVNTAPAAASQVSSGQLTLFNLSGNLWVSQGAIGASVATRSYVNSGSILLGAVLTAVRITTNSTDTFNAGSINILYEG